MCCVNVYHTKYAEAVATPMRAMRGAKPQKNVPPSLIRMLARGKSPSNPSLFKARERSSCGVSVLCNAPERERSAPNGESASPSLGVAQLDEPGVYGIPRLFSSFWNNDSISANERT